MPDRSAGIFIFTISFVEHADNGKVIECFGAGDTDKKSLTMVVTGTTTQTYDTVTNSNVSNENSVFTTVESRPPCDPNDYFVCGALAVAEFVYVIVLVQYLYGSLKMYELFKRVEPDKNVRYIWSLICVWIPVVGFFVSRFAVRKALKGRKVCKECQKQTTSLCYCSYCKIKLCIQCFTSHTSPFRHIKRKVPNQGKSKCPDCEENNTVQEFCINCEEYICNSCAQSHGKKCKTNTLNQVIHVCIGCKKENTTINYCIKCGDYLCKSCSESHYTSHSSQGVEKKENENKCDCGCKGSEVQVHCLTCDVFLCDQSSNGHFGTGPHRKRRGKKECYQCGNPTIQGYCYDCKTYLNLCIECYAKHYSPPHIKRQFPVKGKAECQKCKSKEKVTEFCLNCEGYICIHCYQSHGKDCKTVDNEKGVHECTDCKKENTGNIYCIKCEVYLCKSCSEGHYVRIEHSGVNINVIGEKKDCSDCILIKAQGHCLTCNLFLCEQCFNRHYQTDKHLKRRKKVKKQTLLFKICTVIFGCIFVIGQTLFFLPACLEDCKRSVLPEWHKITLSIKYVVVSLVAVIAVLVFIKLLEDCFYCDDCECKSVADGYCVDCRQYLCNKCVEKHKTKHPPQSVILQHARNQEYVDACRGLKVQYFCLKCKTYFKKHTLLDHMTRLHPEDNDPDFTHIYVQYNPMDSQQIHHNRQKSKELLEMHAGSSTERNDFVCGICSKNKYGTKTSYIICALCFKKQSGGNGDECNQKCKICPDNNMRNINVHCLVCKESMCMTCFEWHKQLYQTWKEPHLYYRQQEEDVRTSSEKSVPSGVVARITAGPLLVGEIIYLIYKYCRKGSKVEPREDQT